MNSVIKIFNYQFTVKDLGFLLLTYFLMEGIFSWIFVRNSILTEGYIKLTSMVIYAFMIFKFFSLKTSEKIYLVLFTVVMLRLVGESLYKYDAFFRQLTMFTVLFPVVFTIFIKYLLRTLQIDLLEFVAKFYLVSYIVFMILFGRGFSFSLDYVDMEDYGPFSGDSRIIHASHILMMIIPLLWYIHQYFSDRKNKYLLIALFCVLVIVVHQHRSVWSSSLVAIFFFIMASIRNKQLTTSRFFAVAAQSVALLLLGYFFILNLAPGLIDFLADRFSEILDPSKEGSTGNFRIEQRDIYTAMFFERPIFGWTFEGFEMANPLVDWWPEMTGQHFHEGYTEMLFYQGIVGFVLKFSFLFYFVFKIFSKNLSPQSIILLSFGISGLVFSFNYVLPIVFWAHVGMGLFYLEETSRTVNSE